MKKTTHKLLDFDMAEALKSPQDIAEYLSQVLSDGDNDELVRALGYVAKSQGMTAIAEKAGLGRESLYKAFQPGSKPQFATVSKVAHALGVQFRAVPIVATRKLRRTAHA
jgi:probable addiction module antidote protein